MAEHTRSAALRPELVLCSSARRTRETLEVLRPALGEEVEVLVEDGLYGAGAGRLLDRLHRIPAAVDSVLLIGHNPGLHDLALELTGDGEEDAVDMLRVKLPTGALAQLDVNVTDWSQLAPGQAYLARLVVPRTLDADR